MSCSCKHVIVRHLMIRGGLSVAMGSLVVMFYSALGLKVTIDAPPTTTTPETYGAAMEGPLYDAKTRYIAAILVSGAAVAVGCASLVIGLVVEAVTGEATPQPNSQIAVMCPEAHHGVADAIALERILTTHHP